jgi:hypothetical protein
MLSSRKEARMPQPIEPGFMVFLADGHDPAGAVRGIDDDGHLVVDIENRDPDQGTPEQR